MENEIEFEKQILRDVDENLIRKRFHYLLDVQKNHREDIDILYKYTHFLTIYSIILNVIIVGVIICSIIMN